ncbi:head maturation protease, ClpP-related [Shinella sp. DD12]|uniref:head maturation protease, ClpP-related n=1 Tax=Shinella sp. DD12 TaxID=1410620 RepID=UPI000437A20D|nr:head maturation protease, ClpP-related [Shinella sp. DD12]EYR81859.1 protease [Shinella sp. DD12]
MIQLDMMGTVGEDFDAATVKFALAQGGDVHVTLNSGGGFAAEGAAIYALLDAHPGRVRVDIVGIAASAASLIAMAGDSIVMFDGAVMMIHDPLNITIGNSAAHAKTIEELESYAKAYAAIYAKRAKISPAAARAIMQAETWYDGEAAVKAGFATAKSSNASAAWAKFDYDKYQKGAAAVAGASSTRASWKQTIMRRKAYEDAFVIRG